MTDTDFHPGLSIQRSLDQLYLDHQRRLDVQVESFLDLQRSVEAQLRFVATAKLILVLRYREAKLMGEQPEGPAANSKQQAPESECRVQDSFCGDTGCEVHGLGPGPEETSSKQPAASSEDPDPELEACSLKLAADESSRSSS